ncbi:MAG: hypothetical protein A3K83_03020 [Omnitrophica WOR_2 bacterium RBG_13_44_8b]|nr:MAG: hypothetical protein A3K83_03020 [Omnitrophica WOR_2 bacterium RBG_13_44_8b]
MKKVVFLLLAVAFVGSLCFAQEPVVTEEETVKTKVRTLICIVDSVSGGSSMAGMKPQITAKDKDDKQWTFQVATDATIVDKNGQATSLSWIAKGTKVEIKYTETPDGPKMAQSVKVLQDW